MVLLRYPYQVIGPVSIHTNNFVYVFWAFMFDAHVQGMPCSSNYILRIITKNRISRVVGVIIFHVMKF